MSDRISDTVDGLQHVYWRLNREPGLLEEIRRDFFGFVLPTLVSVSFDVLATESAFAEIG